MPNRVLKAGVNGSPRLAVCSWQAECMFFRMLTCVDDFGVMECTMDVLMCDVFKSRRRQVNDSKLLKWLVELAEHDLVSVFTARRHLFALRRKRANEIVCSTLQEGSCKCLRNRNREPKPKTVTGTGTEGETRALRNSQMPVSKETPPGGSDSGSEKRDCSDSGSRDKAALMVRDLELRNAAERIAERLRVRPPESHPEESKRRKQAVSDVLTISKAVQHCAGDTAALDTLTRLAAEVAEGALIKKPVAAWIKRVKDAGLFYKTNKGSDILGSSTGSGATG